ncbi:hypothetical protein MJG53_002282 [Ovis ammon polii x Ovis aries]|uniref:Uncharacterized protein n=1 Tax=Ovis ammon polii x Ovis aries TaxID=2918886 RepID=A0ACB9VNN5_9CETA|nr:hypothetical protein MJG53_002282 [Ovis ammon polii x Ovis aries]
MLAQQGRTCSCLIRALRKSRSSTWEPQRRGLLSSLTAEGHCPPVVSRPGFTRGLPAPCSFRGCLCFEDAFTHSVVESVRVLWAGHGQGPGLGSAGGTWGVGGGGDVRGPASSKDAPSLGDSHLDVAFLPLRSKPSVLLPAPPFASFSPDPGFSPQSSRPADRLLGGGRRHGSAAIGLRPEGPPLGWGLGSRAGGKHSARRPGIRTSAAVTVLTLIPGGQRPAVRLRLGKTLTPPEHSTLLSLFATSLVKADVNQSGDGPRSQVGSQRSRGRGLPPLLPSPPSPAVTRKCLISLINKVIFISTVLSEYQQDSLCDTLSPRLSLLTVPIEKMVLGLDELIFADGQCDAKPT